jgi:secondary thiamine-phosphate synthase enzyme
MIAKAVADTGIEDGMACVMTKHSTAAIILMEDEPGLRADLREMLGRLAPKGAGYEHDRPGGDGNGHSHLRATLLGMSVTVPVAEGRLALGRWQQVLLMELDNQGRERQVLVQVLG